MNKGVKIGLYVAGGLAVLAVGFLMVRNAKITRDTNMAESQGFKCGGCHPNGTKKCIRENGSFTIVDCSYKLLG